MSLDRPVGRTPPLDAFGRVAVFGDHALAAPVAGAAVAEAELPAAEPPQPDDDWADIANTPITGSGRRTYITDAMVKKFGASMGCPRCQNGAGTTHMRVERACSAVWRRRPPSRHLHPQLTWQWTEKVPRRLAKCEAMRIEEEMQPWVPLTT